MHNRKPAPTRRPSPLTTNHLAVVAGGEGVRVQLTYQKIESVWKDGNISGNDDWQKHNV